MNLRLLHALIAVTVDEPEEFAGSIALPSFARQSVDVATVVAAGPGEYDKKGHFTPNPVKAGDRVLIANGSGIKIRVSEQEEYLFLTPNEVTGILRNNV